MTIQDRMKDDLAAFEAVKEDYAQPYSTVDIGEMYYFAGRFAEHLQAAMKALEVAIADLNASASWEEGDLVTSKFDNPQAAIRARKAISAINQIMGEK